MTNVEHLDGPGERTGTTTTTRRVEAGDCAGMGPEFVRVADLRRLFGLKRGTAYNLLSAGLIRGCALRVKGARSGVRLIDVDSVRRYIAAEMARQGKA